ncbi:MAG TPA: outer membrane beta-barrel protein [Acidobacteriaceae bacterium]
MFKWAGIFILLFVPPAVLAQASPATVGGTATLWAGGEISSFNPDFACSSNTPFGCKSQLVGPAAFFDMNVKPKWGVEGEARWLHWNGTGGQIESNYLGGGRYRVARYGRLDGWVKLLVGAGLITTPGYPAAGSLKGSYFTYVPGGTVQFRLTHRIAIRGDYEYQVWPSFAGPPTYNSNGVLVQHADGLTPNGFSLGVTYKFLGP